MSTKQFLLAGAAVIGLALGGAQARAAEEVEVIHWWTSGGEAAALQVLREQPREGGRRLEGLPPSPAAAATRPRTVLQARMAAGDPPTADADAGPR